jgi:hypothetical protein
MANVHANNSRAWVKFEEETLVFWSGVATICVEFLGGVLTAIYG